MYAKKKRQYTEIDMDFLFSKCIFIKMESFAHYSWQINQHCVGIMFEYKCTWFSYTHLNNVTVLYFCFCLNELKELSGCHKSNFSWVSNYDDIEIYENPLAIDKDNFPMYRQIKRPVLENWVILEKLQWIESCTEYGPFSGNHFPSWILRMEVYCNFTFIRQNYG